MTPPPIRPDLEWLRTQAVLREYRFHSDLPVLGPLIAWFRAHWNNISTRWYVRPLAQQQSEFNSLVAERLIEQTTRLGAIEAGLAEQAERLARRAEALEAHAAELDELCARSGEHDAWLSDQDRDQVALTHSQAETAARMVQIEQRLAECDRRLAHIEAAGDRAEPA